jgi:hypothetical protein
MKGLIVLVVLVVIGLAVFGKIISSRRIRR